MAAFGLDERTVAAWQRKAGQHAKAVQEQVVGRGQVDLGQVQADELYVKTQGGTVWVATAISVFSRLFLWGAIAPQRDEKLVTQLSRTCGAVPSLGSGSLGGGWLPSWNHRRAQGLPLVAAHRPAWWPSAGIARADLHIVQVVKQYRQRQVSGIERRLMHGCLARAQTIMRMTQVGWGLINTAYVERLNATWRTWSPALTRRSRTPTRHTAELEAALFCTGGVYNFCRIHATLDGTPAMAADLTDHVWSIDEFLRYRVRREMTPRYLAVLPGALSPTGIRMSTPACRSARPAGRVGVSSPGFARGSADRCARTRRADRTPHR